MSYIYNDSEWPEFTWDKEKISPLLVEVRHRQGRLLGRMEGLGFSFQAEATLETLTMDILKSSEIEGEMLNPDQVRSSIARRLGMDIAGLIPADRNVEGIVEMMLDATQEYTDPLTKDRLFGWHAALFPAGRSGMSKIVTGDWRQPAGDPMQVVSGPMGREKVHFQAPDAGSVDNEMNTFLAWFNGESNMDPVIKAAIAHLWFVTIHPFEDGNGRITRALTDLLLARTDGTKKRFYSMSAQIRKERKGYYNILEQTQKGDLDITPWLEWFLNCLDRAILATDEILLTVIKKSRFWGKPDMASLNDRQKIMINKLLDGFDGKLTSSKWAKITGSSSDTAVRDINALVEKGILIKEAAGGRSTSYILTNN